MEKQEWAEIWTNHLPCYSGGVPRAGIYIKTFLKGLKSSLEVGCGSARDSIYLSTKKIKAIASDYEPKLISILQENHKNELVDFQVVDAFMMPFDDKSFDLVFHNGLFVYFDDNDIVKLIHEQVRIASKYILIMVHNKHNIKQQNTFAKNAKTDSLYNIRFFDIESLEKVINLSGIKYKSIKYCKFGGKADMFWMKKLKGIPNFIYLFRNFLIPRLYRFQSWKITERIACIIEL
ncbi:MAG: class I SAM-dependent methyltransferase [Marinilabiliaceae bacterium]|nr:class I SAM-dependent methyltransferase [Marinilabiliaceae bacterium]